MNSKIIKEELLANKCNSKKFDEYLDKDFDNAIKGLLNALFVSLKNNDKRKTSYFMDELERNSVANLSIEKKNIIIKCILDVITRCDKHLNKNTKKELKKILERLKQISLGLKATELDEVSNILKIIIYEEKDLAKIANIVNEHNNIFRVKSVRNLFKVILKDCINNNDEYLYKVISIILNSSNRNQVLVNKDEYIALLKSKNSILSRQIINKFDNNFKIAQEDIENRYDILFDYKRVIIPKFDDRVNYRNMVKFPSITIDDEGNMCNDDAISIYKNNNGTYTLRIDIASIPALISFNSNIDKEALRRSETIYLKDREIILYPELVSYDRASLLENRYRYVISYKYIVDPKFNIIKDSLEIFPSRIFISNNLSFDQADILINGNKDDNLSIMLRQMCEVMNVYSSKRLIEKMMSLPKSDVGLYFKNNGYPFIYKIYLNNKEEIKEKVTNVYGNANKNGTMSKLLKILMDDELKSTYSSVPNVHVGVKEDAYAPITSPLRSYPDALAEYIIYDILIKNNIDNKNLYNWENILKQRVEYINNRLKLNKAFQKEYAYLDNKNRIKRK